MGFSDAEVAKMVELRSRVAVDVQLRISAVVGIVRLPSTSDVIASLYVSRERKDERGIAETSGGPILICFIVS